MRLINHLHEAEDEKDKEKPEEKPEDKEKKEGEEAEKSADELADETQEEKDKAIERVLDMIMKATTPSMMNLLVDQTAPLFVRWGDEWMDKLEDALYQTVSDRLAREFVKITKQKSIRFHHIKSEVTGKAADDEIDAKRGKANPKADTDVKKKEDK